MVFKELIHSLQQMAQHTSDVLKDFQEKVEEEDLENMFHIHEMESLLKELKEQLDDLGAKAADKMNLEGEKLKEAREECEEKFEKLKEKVEKIRKKLEDEMDHESFKERFESIANLRNSPILDDIRKMADSLESQMEGIKDQLKKKVEEIFKR